MERAFICFWNNSEIPKFQDSKMGKSYGLGIIEILKFWNITHI